MSIFQVAAAVAQPRPLNDVSCKISTLTGETLDFELKKDGTVHDLKHAIATVSGFLYNCRTLMLDGRILDARPTSKRCSAVYCRKGTLAGRPYTPQYSGVEY